MLQSSQARIFLQIHKFMSITKSNLKYKKETMLNLIHIASQVYTLLHLCSLFNYCSWYICFLVITLYLMGLYFCNDVAFQLPRCANQVTVSNWIPLEPKMGNTINGWANLVSYFVNYYVFCISFHVWTYCWWELLCSDYLTDEALNFKRYCNEPQLQH